MENILETKTIDLLHGYTDKEGNFHTDCDITYMDGNVEENISKGTIKNNGGKIIRTILVDCVTRIGTLVKENFKKNEWVEIIQDLEIPEQDYLVLKIREMSVGEEIQVKHKCPNEECNKDLETFIGIDELETIPHNGLTEIPFTLPKGFMHKGQLIKEGTLRIPKGLDREILDPIVRKNTGLAHTLMLSRIITSFEQDVKPTDKITRNLIIKDREYLYKVVEENMYGIKFDKIELSCPECGEVFEGNLNIVNFI